MLIVGIILLVVGGILFLVRQSTLGKLEDLKQVEQKTVAELQAMAGDLPKVVAVRGTIECAEPLYSALGERECVYYRSSVTRHYTVTEVVQDSSSSGSDESYSDEGEDEEEAPEKKVAKQPEKAAKQPEKDVKQPEKDVKQPKATKEPQKAAPKGK